MTTAGRRDAWAAALPGLLIVVTAAVLLTADGGYAPKAWYPAALFLLALAAVVVFVAPGGGSERSRLLTVAAGLLGALGLWSLASMLWAEDAAAAWDGGNRTLMYALAFALLVMRPWRRPAADAAVALVALAAGAAAVAVLVATATSDAPTRLFLEGRLADPLGYANATANLWLIGLFPALWLALAPDRAWFVRGPSLALACLLLQTALLSQSRGAALACATASVAFVALSPRRVPALLAVGLLGGLAALSFDTLTAVKQSLTLPALEAATAEAREAIVRACAIALAAGAAAALAGGRAPEAVTGPRARRAGDALVALIGVAAVVAALVAIGNPREWAEARWDDFKNTSYEQIESAENRFSGSLGSDRYDFYRVALDDFSRAPLIGQGADNFAVSYLRERRPNTDAARHPHSLALRLLGQTGLIGALLFLGFLVLALIAALRARSRATLSGRALIAGAVAGFLAFLVHSQVDWLWPFPALVLLALVLLGVAASLDERPPDTEPVAAAPVTPEEPVARPVSRPATLVASGALLLAMAVSFAAPGLSARFSSAAYAEFSSNPERTLARLERAAELNPLSNEPLMARAILARRLGRDDVALADFRRAVAREPSDWFAHFELALQEAAAGRRTEAVEAARRAARLNPRQQAITRLIQEIERGTTVEPSEYEAILSGQLRRRLTPVGESG